MYCFQNELVRLYLVSRANKAAAATTETANVLPIATCLHYISHAKSKGSALMLPPFLRVDGFRERQLAQKKKKRSRQQDATSAQEGTTESQASYLCEAAKQTDAGLRLVRAIGAYVWMMVLLDELRKSSRSCMEARTAGAYWHGVRCENVQEAHAVGLRKTELWVLSERVLTHSRAPHAVDALTAHVARVYDENAFFAPRYFDADQEADADALRELVARWRTLEHENRGIRKEECEKGGRRFAAAGASSGNLPGRTRVPSMDAYSNLRMFTDVPCTVSARGRACQLPPFCVRMSDDNTTLCVFTSGEYAYEYPVYDHNTFQLDHAEKEPRWVMSIDEFGRVTRADNALAHHDMSALLLSMAYGEEAVLMELQSRTSGKCLSCGARLTRTDSQDRGMGPTCYGRLRFLMGGVVSNAAEKAREARQRFQEGTGVLRIREEPVRQFQALANDGHVPHCMRRHSEVWAALEEMADGLDASSDERAATATFVRLVAESLEGTDENAVRTACADIALYMASSRAVAVPQGTPREGISTKLFRGWTRWTTGESAMMTVYPPTPQRVRTAVLVADFLGVNPFIDAVCALPLRVDCDV